MLQPLTTHSRRKVMPTKYPCPYLRRCARVGLLEPAQRLLDCLSHGLVQRRELRSQARPQRARGPSAHRLPAPRACVCELGFHAMLQQQRQRHRRQLANTPVILTKRFIGHGDTILTAR